MSKLLLSSSLCEECGICCYSCEFLDTRGCTNHTFRMKSRCASFPLLFGIPKLMGYINLTGAITESHESKEKKMWFFYDFYQCSIQQNEKLYNTLRWLIEDVNNGKEISWFFVKSEEIELSTTILR